MASFYSNSQPLPNTNICPPILLSKINWEKKKYYHNDNICGYKFSMSLHTYFSEYEGKRKVYFSLDFYINESYYTFKEYIDENIPEEDFLIIAEKIKRKWKKIMKDIIVKIEMEDEEDDKD